MHDPLAVDVAIHPSVVKQILPINLTVETDGQTTGRMIGNMELLNETQKSCFMCLDVDSKGFIKRFTETIKELSQRNK